MGGKRRSRVFYCSVAERLKSPRLGVLWTGGDCVECSSFTGKVLLSSKDRYAEQIDICDQQHDGLRKQLLEDWRKTATWIRNRFILSDDVVTSNGDHFNSLLGTWRKFNGKRTAASWFDIFILKQNDWRLNLWQPM